MKDPYLPQILGLLAAGLSSTALSVSGYLHQPETFYFLGTQLTYQAAYRKIPLALLGTGFSVSAWLLTQTRRDYRRQYEEWERQSLLKQGQMQAIAHQAEIEGYQQVAKLQAAERFYPQMAPYLGDEYAAYEEVVPQPPTQPSTRAQATPEPVTTTPTAPPTASEIAVYLGQSPTAQPVYWQPSRQNNGFILLLGASGSGKTEALKVLAAEMDHQGIPVLILDFHGDVTLNGAQEYVLSANSGYGINPMSLDSTDPNDGGVFAHRYLLLNLLNRALPSIGHRQRRVLDEAIAAVYAQAGFRDNDAATWTKPAPTFADVMHFMQQMVDTAEAGRKALIESAIDAIAAIFGHPIFNQPHQIQAQDFLQHSQRLNLSYLEDQVLQFMVADTILRKLYRCLRSKGVIPVQPASDRERYRIFVAIDEAKIVATGGAKDDPKAVLNIGATEYRKYGLAWGCASQISKHYSDEFRSQMASRLILKPFDMPQASINAPDIGLTPDEIMGLQGQGDGWFKMGSSAVERLQIQPLHARAHLAHKPQNQPTAHPAASQPLSNDSESVEPPQKTPGFRDQVVDFIKDCWQAESPQDEPKASPSRVDSLPAGNLKNLALYLRKKEDIAVRAVRQNWGSSYSLNGEQVSELLIQLIELNLIETYTPIGSKAEWVRWLET